MSLSSIAIRNAISHYGHPIAGLLLDPSGAISSMGMPNWQSKQLGLQFPAKITHVNGRPLRSPGGPLRLDIYEAAVRKAVSTGNGSVSVRTLQNGKSREVSLRVHSLEPAAWWLFGGSMLFSGILWVGAGLIALRASPHGRLARAFAHVAFATGAFLLTVFDFHTTRELVAVFLLSFALQPALWVLLALRLPTDTRLLLRWPAIAPAMTTIAGLVGTAACALYFSGRSTTALQQLISALFATALFAVAVVFVVRYFAASPHHRRAMRALLIAAVPTIGLSGALVLGLLYLGPSPARLQPIAWPALALTPLAAAFAYARHDLFESKGLLSRLITRCVMFGLAIAIGIAAATALGASVGIPFGLAVKTAAVTAVLVAALVLLASWVSERALFPSRAVYKPTVAKLSEELTSVAKPEEVASAIERTVRRWLSCDDVAFYLTLEGNGGTQAKSANGAQLPPSSATRRREDRSSGEIELPATFGTRQLGTLVVGAKRGGALFTTDDVDLLDTIVNQGALALAHAEAYQELEQRRRQQAKAWRGEREALVETVAAEIAHEIRYPINYFRSVFERSARGEQLDAEDIDIGREEVDRLERLVSGLRRVASHRLERRTVPLRELCNRAEVLLRDSLDGRTIEVDIEAGDALKCDFDQATQILVNLLSNALQATDRSGRLGIRFQRSEGGTDLVVWDGGRGFVGNGAKLFVPWYTTKSRGTGLGLAITHRLVRAHGWNISAQRRGGKTEFAIRVRPEDVSVLGEQQSGDDLRPGANVA